jgi:TatD DNase family protein
VETDCPFLAPVPYRGKRNEPAYVVEVARCIAELRGVEVEEVARVTTENFKRFLRLG